MDIDIKTLWPENVDTSVPDTDIFRQPHYDPIFTARSIEQGRRDRNFHPVYATDVLSNPYTGETEEVNDVDVQEILQARQDIIAEERDESLVDAITRTGNEIYDTRIRRTTHAIRYNELLGPIDRPSLRSPIFFIDRIPGGLTEMGSVSELDEIPPQQITVKSSEDPEEIEKDFKVKQILHKYHTLIHSLPKNPGIDINKTSNKYAGFLFEFMFYEMSLVYPEVDSQYLNIDHYNYFKESDGSFDINLDSKEPFDFLLRGVPIDCKMSLNWKNASLSRLNPKWIINYVWKRNELTFYKPTTVMTKAKHRRPSDVFYLLDYTVKDNSLYTPDICLFRRIMDIIR